MNSSAQALDPVALVQHGIGCDQAGRYDDAAATLQRAIALMAHDDDPDPLFFDALRYLVHALAGLGRHDAAERALADVALPKTEPGRRSLALVHCGLAADFTYFGEYLRAIRQYRIALAHASEVGARVNLSALLTATGERAVLADYMDAMAADAVQPFMLIACMPKSGSSFLKNALCALTGWKETELAYAYAQSEQELYLPHVIAAANFPSVTQQHCRATEANIHIMQGFGIRPVVLVRNIHDIVVSLFDFYEDGAVANTFLASSWPELTHTEKLDLIVDHVLPWYFAFHASWVAVERAGAIEFIWMTYEELTADKPAALARISRFQGMSASPQQLAAAVAAAEGNRVASRFNKGVAGRGSSLLNGEQKARIARLASRYRGIDFSRTGL